MKQAGSKSHRRQDGRGRLHRTHRFYTGRHKIGEVDERSATQERQRASLHRHRAMREWVGLAASWLTGRSSPLFPRHKLMRAQKENSLSLPSGRVCFP
jgi:hypothetical protein